MMERAKVCIVGAGSSGIAAAKVLQERGIAFDCFEKGSGIGGLWRYDNDNGMSAAYASLHIISSRSLTQYSDFPMPRDYPDFPHHSQMLDYFESYVDHFGFRDKITFCSTVKSIRQTERGTYRVDVEIDGQLRSEEYVSVIVANGHHWKPRWPTFPGQFTGETLHSHEYRVPDTFRDKKVLVVGLGNSACDIACEVSRVAQKTYLSVRRGVHIIPKYLFGKPLDRVWPAFLWRYTPLRVMQWVFSVALRLVRGRMTRFQLPKPEHRILEEHPTVSSDLLNAIGHGRIHVVPEIDRLAGNEVCFGNGDTVEADTIIYATGYHIAFPFLDSSVLDTRENQVPLYKRVVHPERPHLYFIGLIQPWGPIMPLAELQSEWVGDLLQGETSLPTKDEMIRSIEHESEKMQRRYTRSPRHTIQVDYYPYRDELCRERKRGRSDSSALDRVLSARHADAA